MYDPNQGISFTKSGLHVLRAYATENEKLSSAIITSRFVEKKSIIE